MSTKRPRSAPKSAPSPNETARTAGERVAKFLSRAGVCSRRDAEARIGEGRVSVDGVTLTSPATFVTGTEDIRVDGQRVSGAESARLFRYHKPIGELVTARDPQGRATVFDKLPPELPRLVTIGRLDLNSEGLLLMTNDGGLARHLELPATGWTRRYRIRAFGKLDMARLEKLSKGVTIDGIRYGAIHVQHDRTQGHNHWLSVSLKEGKNREVRKVMGHVGLTVNRLIRTAYGPFLLGQLGKGEIAEVPPKQLREFLGDRFTT